MFSFAYQLTLDVQRNFAGGDVPHVEMSVEYTGPTGVVREQLAEPPEAALLSTHSLPPDFQGVRFKVDFSFPPFQRTIVVEIFLLDVVHSGGFTTGFESCGRISVAFAGFDG